MENNEKQVSSDVTLDLKDKRNLAGIDLSEQDLSGKRFAGANMKGANLSDTVLDNALLAGIDLNHRCRG